MIDKKDQFYLISLLSNYLLIKDSEKLFSDLNSSDEKKFTEIVKKYISNIEGYEHLPNKAKIIKESYDFIISASKDDSICEESILNKVAELSAGITLEEKRLILNSVIYVAHHNQKISQTEKEVIVQVAHFLDLEANFKKIFYEYKKSDFAPQVSKIKTGFAVAVALIIGLVAVFLLNGFLANKNNELKIFNQERVVFNEVAMNRMVTYSNKFNIRNDNFLKQVVIYFHGDAEVSFNPNDLRYDPTTKTVTLMHGSDSIFNYSLDLKPHIVDELNPLPISREDALKISAVIGVAGATVGGVAGNKLGGLFGSVLPSGSNFITSAITTGVGAVIGGAGSAYLSFKLLDGLQLSDKFNERERDSVIRNSEALIKALLMTDPELENLLKENFETFIKQIYSAYDVEVLQFKYVEKEGI
jgi:hypothetical protein